MMILLLILAFDFDSQVSIFPRSLHTRRNTRMPEKLRPALLKDKKVSKELNIIVP